MMLVTVFIVIVVCWLPISLSFMADKKNVLPSIVYVSFVILAWLNSCVNIFIYAGMNTQFRKAYVELITTPFVKKVKTITSTASNSGFASSGDSRA
ncbi:GPR84 [Bugula neritina]|uniref:GPR84 n=1 Tax=Bugula neritina TaxID=10212 RepID=A0A7J7IU48_BUGNE|nr:GPR84 [Bugula neritina]